MKRPSATKSLSALLLLLFITFYQSFAQTNGVESRMNEVFQVTELTHGTPGSTRFYDPWEVTYGPDDSLWITEAKNYKVYKMSPNGGTPRMILDISPGSTFLPSAAFNLSFPTSFPTLKGGGYSTSTGNAPQGGLAGLAIHPKFPDSPYVFVSYIWKFIKQINANSTVTATTTGTTTTTTTGTPAGGGVYYQNALVRFTYNFTTGLLGSPMAVCDTLPGSSDHNSQRIIIAPIGSTYYLFYANGDMGSGQFGNSARVENAQNLNSYEGKILRFNLDPDADGGAYDKWIPSTIPNANPFNASLGKQSAVWAFGFRNNQGFAYAKINGTDYLYGQMHGPFSDDEINVIHGGGNYGHPLVIGYKKDGNHNSAAAGNPYTNWTDGSGKIGGLPVIVNETHNADSMNQFHTYYDPIFTYYPAAAGSALTSDLTNGTAVPAEMASIQYMYYWFNQGQQSNTYWPSEAPSGMDVYTNSRIPGWKNSLISCIMKGAPSNTANWSVNASGGTKGAPASPGGSGTAASGKLFRLKLNSNGDSLFISPTNADSTLKSPSAYAEDTISYFASQNRFRDIAISPDGLSLFAIIDSSQTTSGPTATNPANSLCKGCLLKFTFLGYANAGGKSTIPNAIDVTDGTVNTCNTGTTVVINSSNNNMWVPITGPDGNIMAEIYANGQNLDTVWSSFYKKSGGIRIKNGVHYLDRNITIKPKNKATSPVKLRFYFSKAEYDALDLDGLSGVSAITDLKIYKNKDACGSAISSSTKAITLSFEETHGANGYMLQGDSTLSATSSSFYFATAPVTLPVDLVYFKGSLQNNTTLLNWETANEKNTSEFIVERSIDGSNFNEIGTVPASGNTSSQVQYSYTDNDVTRLSSLIIYYRLKLADIDGAYKYSNVITISLADITGAVTVAPNPMTNELRVTMQAPAEGPAQWKLVDNNGRVVLENTALLRKGNNSMIINVSKLSVGMYYLSVSGAGIDQRVKLQKL